MEDRVEGMKRLLGIPDHIVPSTLVRPWATQQRRSREWGRFIPDRVHLDGW